MDLLEISELISFLSLIGFNLAEASLNYLRFERQEVGKYSEIEIITISYAILVKLKYYNKSQFYDAADFNELKYLLKEKIE